MEAERKKEPKDVALLSDAENEEDEKDGEDGEDGEGRDNIPDNKHRAGEEGSRHV